MLRPATLVLGLLAAWAAARAETACKLEPGPHRTVARVIDGETMALDGGEEVRLVGALAPHPGDGAAAHWPPAEAARDALEALVDGREVELRFAGRRKDRWGRTLAHVFVPRASGGPLWVQGHLLSHGHARAYALPGNEACLADLMAEERRAREAGLGLWASAAYRVRDAGDTAALLRRRGRFEIVEGRVASVAARTARTYLNFGRDWRRDFTVSVSQAVLGTRADAEAWLDALKGKRVRVRGWIERRNGPLIEIAALDEIEPLDPSSDPPGAR